MCRMRESLETERQRVAKLDQEAREYEDAEEQKKRREKKLTQQLDLEKARTQDLEARVERAERTKETDLNPSGARHVQPVNRRMEEETTKMRLFSGN